MFVLPGEAPGLSQAAPRTVRSWRAWCEIDSLAGSRTCDGTTTIAGAHDSVVNRATQFCCRIRAIVHNMRTIAITIEEHMLKAIDRLAQGEGSSNRSRVIREALREYLLRVERLEEEVRETEIFRRHRGQLARQAAALVKEQAKP